MTMSLEPTGLLAAALEHADRAREFAHHWNYRVRLLNVARVLRDSFPSAATVIIDTEQRHVWPEGVQLAGVLDTTGALLWSATLPASHALADYSTSDGSTWELLQAQIEDDLTDALGMADPAEHWEKTDHSVAEILHRRGVSAPQLFGAALPTADDVLTAQAAPATGTRKQRRRAQYYNRSTARYLHASDDHELPALSIGGALVFAYVDPSRDRPSLCVSLDLDDVAPGLKSLPNGAVALEIRVGDTPVFFAPVE